ncbi:protein phosphatase 2C domain-containing protein [Lentzea aerocolonigenes]|uniref:protein phosphatase 2C domain-containing protein n=1 Tax=Lentzea aerocolonigenes TaxID=68170 RepID=UPI0004C427F3|nr:protein phosphatase 2C domain-containing protein [Lentzea aerocolonigenes]MCP2247364.1 Protein phosphatase 2C [Lentzea aerocolonigenes]
MEPAAEDAFPVLTAPAGTGRDSVPDVAGHRCRVGQLQLSAASVIGSRHRQNGEVREDAYAFATGKNSCGVAVADGVGSAINAHMAANAAARCAVDEVVRWADTRRSSWIDHCVELVHRTSDAVRQVPDTRAGHPAAKNNPPAATLSVATLRMLDDATTEVNWLAYGDTAVLKLSLNDGRWTWLSGKEQARSNVTHALPGPFENSVHGETVLEPDHVFVIATDGVAEAIEAMPAEFAEAITGTVLEAMSAAKFTTLLDFDVQGMADDRTILLVWQPR